MSKSLREEKLLNPIGGMLVLIVSILLLLGAVAGFVLSVINLDNIAQTGLKDNLGLYVTGVVVTAIYFTFVFPLTLLGLKVINPNEAGVYVLFGKYFGTIAKEGFFWINPFCISVASASDRHQPKSYTNIRISNNKISLKATTLNNEKQKVNDKDGNPIEIGAVVIWRVVSATKAVFEVDDYKTYISTQCDATIRNIARNYPYDLSEEGDEKSLRASSGVVAEEMKNELQNRVNLAGIEIIEVRITHLAYAQEIAAAMLQRQQATAIIAARQKIVEGAVGMVEMALNKLAENEVVALDEERKAAMVSNLLVVLCGSKDAQPIVNSGSLY